MTDEQKDGVASEAQNAKLEHSAGGATTRDDRHDIGVPMLQGDPSERQGPEDALGEGSKRGDYRDRVPGNPHEARTLDGGGEPVYANAKTGKPAKAGDENAVQVDVAPASEVVAQAPRTEDIGDVEGKKGGVETA
jgi:hypothetical protein